MACDGEFIGLASLKGIRCCRQQLLAPAAGPSGIEKLDVHTCICAGTPDVTGESDHLQNQADGPAVNDVLGC
jgi:hypothetical protein